MKRSPPSSNIIACTPSMYIPLVRACSHDHALLQEKLGNGSLIQVGKGVLTLGSMRSSHCPQEVTSESRTQDSSLSTRTTDLLHETLLGPPVSQFHQYNSLGLLFSLYKGRIPRVSVIYPKQPHKLCHWPLNLSESALCL